MTSKAPVFEKIYQDYLARVAGLDLTEKQDLLGIRVDAQTVFIPFFNDVCKVTPRNITDHKGRRPPHSVCVILCQYLLLSPDRPEDDRQLVTYRDFRDAAPYVQGFDNTARKPVSRTFSGRLAELEAECRQLGGTPCDIGISCDLSYMFEAHGQYFTPDRPLSVLWAGPVAPFPPVCYNIESYRIRGIETSLGLFPAGGISTTGNHEYTRTVYSLGTKMPISMIGFDLISRKQYGI